jgi:hypothetical protein
MLARARSKRVLERGSAMAALVDLAERERKRR